MTGDGQVMAWAPPGAELTRLHFRNRAPVLSGSTVVCSGAVAAVDTDRSVTIDLEIRVDDSYDGLNRLVASEADGEADGAYGYDAVGNRLPSG